MDVEWEEPKSGTPTPDLPSCEFGQILPHLWNSGFCSINQAYKFLPRRMDGRISQEIKMDKHLERCVANGRQSKNARSEFIHSFIHIYWTSTKAQAFGYTQRAWVLWEALNYLLFSWEMGERASLCQQENGKQGAGAWAQEAGCAWETVLTLRNVIVRTSFDHMQTKQWVKYWRS